MHKTLPFLAFIAFPFILFCQQPHGNCVHFDGTSDYYEIPDNGTTDFVNELTIEAWVNPCDTLGNRIIVSKMWCQGSQMAYYFSIINGKIRFNWDDTGYCNDTPNYYESAPLIFNDIWQHVAVSFSQSGITMYLNGQPVGGSIISGSITSITNSNQPVLVSAYRFLSGTLGDFWDGAIDEVRIWNYARSSNEIANDYNQLLSGNEAGLIVYHEMENIAGGTISNLASSTGASNNGQWQSISTGYEVQASTFTCSTLQIILNDTTILAETDCGTLDGSITVDANGDTYELFDSSGNLIATNTTGVFNGLGAGNYYVVIHLGSLNMQVDNLIVPSNGNVPVISSEVTTDQTDCISSDGTITVISNGTSYELFDDSNSLVSSNSTGVFTGLSAGDYYVVVYDGPCSTIGSLLMINDATSSTSNTISVFVCQGSIYTFVDGSQQNITSDTNHTSTLMNSVGCDSLVTEQVSIIQPTTIILDTTICEGSNYSSIIDAASFTNVLVDFQYTSTLVDSNGCDSIIIENVTVIPVPTIDLGLGFSVCTGDSIILSATTNGAIPVWNTGDTSMSISITITGDETFFATVSDQCGSSSDSILITTLASPIVDAGPDLTIPLGATVDLEVSSTTSPISYEWTPSVGLTCDNCDQTTASPISNASYIVMGIDENGCIGYDTVNVTIDGEISFYIPNIFSPNNDGENDFFQVFGPNWKYYRIEVYNRLGGLVFKSEDPNIYWDGKHYKNQIECPQSVFVYKFWGVSVFGMTYERAGNVMLTR